MRRFVDSLMFLLVAYTVGLPFVRSVFVSDDEVRAEQPAAVTPAPSAVSPSSTASSTASSFGTTQEGRPDDGRNANPSVDDRLFVGHPLQSASGKAESWEAGVPAGEWCETTGQHPTVEPDLTEILPGFLVTPPALDPGSLPNRDV